MTAEKTFKKQKKSIKMTIYTELYMNQIVVQKKFNRNI